MSNDQIAHNAIANAGWYIAHRLLAPLVEKDLLTNQEVISVLQDGVEANAAGGPTNQAAALLLEQIKTYHEKAAGLTTN